MNAPARSESYRYNEPEAGTPREEAVPRLFEAHAGRLFSLGRRFCGNDDEAADLVQDVFLQAWRD